MVRRKSLEYWLVFLYLAFFPLGQIPKLVFILAGSPVYVHPTDIIVLIFALVTVISSAKTIFKPIYKPLLAFISVLGFSWLCGALLFTHPSLAPSFFYLIRTIALIIFFIQLPTLVRNKIFEKKQLQKGLIVIGLSIATIGLIQYLLIPDLRSLHTLGWDDHYYRLVSSFLDPAYTGILLILTILLFVTIKIKKIWLKTSVMIFLIVCLILTYSRASYLSLIAPLFFLSARFKFAKTLIAFSLIIMTFIVFLPKAEGEGTNLLRTNSVIAKIQNYQQSLKLYTYSPLFGIGYNNVCIAKLALLGDVRREINSCGGLDSSILFILATTGIVGLISFGYANLYLWNSSTDQSRVWKACLIAIAIHGIFTNTYFYPWVMGWLALLHASLVKTKE